MKRIYGKIRSHSPPNRAPSPTCLHCDVTHISLTTGIVALRISSWRVREREERRQARRTLWSVYAGRVIFHYLNHLHGIIKYYKHFWDSFLEVWVAGLSIIAINHIGTGAKTAAGTRSPLWRTRLLDSESCSFTHPAVRGIKCSFSPKSTQSCYNMSYIHSRKNKTKQLYKCSCYSKLCHD